MIKFMNIMSSSYQGKTLSSSGWKNPSGKWNFNDGGAVIKLSDFGGDPGSTWIAKPEVHAEDATGPRKKSCKPIVANDDNYALAA